MSHASGGSCCGNVDRHVVARLSVDLESGLAVATAATDEVCLACREMLTGTSRGSRISQAQRQTLLGQRSLGKRDSAARLQLPDWGDARLDIAEPSIAKRLLNNYATRPRQEVLSNIMTACGASATASHVLSTPPAGVPQMRIERPVLLHIINTGQDHHVRYAPLIRAVLDDPTEAWARDVDGKRDQIHYLRKFNNAGNEITVLVVGDYRGRFLRTAFLLSGRQQAQRKRDGTFLYANWIGK